MTIEEIREKRIYLNNKLVETYKNIADDLEEIHIQFDKLRAQCPHNEVEYDDWDYAFCSDCGFVYY